MDGATRLRTCAKWLGIGIGLVALTTTGACRNACQSMCVTLADYSEECGVSVSDAEVDACIDALATPEDADLQVCRDFGTRQALDNQVGCENIDLLWGDTVDGGDS